MSNDVCGNIKILFPNPFNVMDGIFPLHSKHNMNYGKIPYEVNGTQKWKQWSRVKLIHYKKIRGTKWCKNNTGLFSVREIIGIYDHVQKVRKEGTNPIFHNSIISSEMQLFGNKKI
jgi:hypothetical protein